VTMVVPIFMPDAERGTAGELVGLFNKRPFRRFVLTNIIDKVIRQSRFYRRHIIRKLDRTDYLHRVDMEAGNLYLFWGYRSLHGNMPCESGALRATLILHLGRPHGSSEALTAAVRFGQCCALSPKSVLAGNPLRASTHRVETLWCTSTSIRGTAAIAPAPAPPCATALASVCD
jgi:hypothetical protein